MPNSRWRFSKLCAASLALLFFRTPLAAVQSAAPTYNLLSRVLYTCTGLVQVIRIIRHTHDQKPSARPYGHLSDEFLVAVKNH
jgi:hypothetical protein